jgi:hypothetical protein
VDPKGKEGQFLEKLKKQAEVNEDDMSKVFDFYGSLK